MWPQLGRPESVEDCNEGTRFLGLVRDRFENAVSPTPSESSESPLSADPHWPEIHVKNCRQVVPTSLPE